MGKKVKYIKDKLLFYDFEDDLLTYIIVFTYLIAFTIIGPFIPLI